MDFNQFINAVPKLIDAQLTATYSHNKMMPPERVELMKKIDFDALVSKKAAVLMLIYPKNKAANLVLIVRNSYPGVHSSQIAFPGGKVEEYDSSLQATALRETEEEIGIPQSQIKIIKAFSEVYIPPSNYMVYPYLGYSMQELVFLPDPAEVAAVIEWSLTDFLDDRNCVNYRLSTSYNADIEVPAFKFNNHIIWGATAMMLSELKDVLKKVF